MLGWVGWDEDGEACRIPMKGGLYLETLVKLTIRAKYKPERFFI